MKYDGRDRYEGRRQWIAFRVEVQTSRTSFLLLLVFTYTLTLSLIILFYFLLKEKSNKR